MSGSIPRRLHVGPGSLAEGARVVTGDDYHYLFRVRRLRVGDMVTLFDGEGVEAEARVREIDERRAVLDVAAPRAQPARSGCRLTVAQALIKGERMDWCIQKLVELGVGEIVPVRCARSVVELRGERAVRRHRRFLAIAADAARQSRRATVPKVGEIIDLNQLWKRRSRWDVALMARVGEGERTLMSRLPAAGTARICVAIGPEGGFAEEEIAAARVAGFEPVELGAHVLRSETAAVAVASLIGFHLGDL